MAYTSGNLALKPKRRDNEQEEVIRETRRLVVKKKTIPMGEKLLYLFTVLLCVAIAGLIISRYTQIYDSNMKMKQLNTQYQTLTVEMEEMKRQVEMLSSPERIRKMAEIQGMTTNYDNGISVNRSASGSAAQSSTQE